MRITGSVLAALSLCVAATAASARADYAVRDGDTVVFLGDSITAARQYSRVIEQYTLLRFPERKVRFVNAGKGGETAQLALDRLNDAVFANNATLVTVAYGVNDIGWGTKADAEHRQQYLDAVGEIIDRCRAREVRVFICSAAITAEDPDKAERGFLQGMCDDGLAAARGKGAGAIDVQRSMRSVQRRVLAANEKRPAGATPATMHAPDGVHLNDLGQMAMAWAILKGLGAPADVSSAAVDASSGSVVNASDCQVSDVQRTDDGVSFTRLDARLPLNLAPLWMLHGMYVPISDELNRYPLTITGLPAGRYLITAGGRPLGEWDAGALARGVNLASATADPWVPGGPWDAQAHALKVFTDMRDELVFARRGMDANLTAHPGLADLRARADAVERQIVELQREIARPVSVEFVVRRVAADRGPVPPAGKK
jgi:lysophospholipase L1-like esterase